MSTTLRTAFRDAHDWRPEPAPEALDDIPPDATAFARWLLRAIAEDALLRPSHRVAARRYLRRLEGQVRT